MTSRAGRGSQACQLDVPLAENVKHPLVPSDEIIGDDAPMALVRPMQHLTIGSLATDAETARRTGSPTPPR